MRTVYSQTRGPAAAEAARGEITAEVAIVGAGITGLSAALHLAEAGTDVVVLDAHAVGWGASGRNGGQINPGLKNAPTQIIRDFGDVKGRAILDLAHTAVDALDRLVVRLGIDCQLKRSGTLRVAKDDKQAATLEILDADYRSNGLGSTFLSAPQVRAATGSGLYAAGMFDERGGHLNPLRYTEGLALGAVGAGARIFVESPVIAVKRAGDGWTLQLPQGIVRCRTVVLATNGYTDGLWPGLKRTVVPAYSAIAATEPLSEEIASSILPGRPSVFEIGMVTVYYRIDADNRLLIGGRSYSRDITDLWRLRYLTDYAKTIWPQLGATKFSLGWNGQIALTRDHYPHLHHLDRGMWAGLGYNGRGVAMGTVMGEQLARCVMHGAETATLPVTAMQPFPFHAFWRTGVAAAIKWGQLKQMLGQ